MDTAPLVNVQILYPKTCWKCGRETAPRCGEYIPSGVWVCAPCAVEYREDHRAYHEVAAEEELVRRLNFEPKWGFMSPNEITNDTWLRKSLRDNGHDKWLREMVVACLPPSCLTVETTFGRADVRAALADRHAENRRDRMLERHTEHAEHLFKEVAMPVANELALSDIKAGRWSRSFDDLQDTQLAQQHVHDTMARLHQQAALYTRTTSEEDMLERCKEELYSMYLKRHAALLEQSLDVEENDAARCRQTAMELRAQLDACLNLAAVGHHEFAKKSMENVLNAIAFLHREVINHVDQPKMVSWGVYPLLTDLFTRVATTAHRLDQLIVAEL